MSDLRILQYIFCHIFSEFTLNPGFSFPAILFRTTVVGVYDQSECQSKNLINSVERIACLTERETFAKNRSLCVSIQRLIGFNKVCL